MQSLDYFLSHFQIVILSLNNCSGYGPKCSFQHHGTRRLSYVTNFGMKGRNVCTMNCCLHRKGEFQGKAQSALRLPYIILSTRFRKWLQRCAAIWQNRFTHASVPVIFQASTKCKAVAFAQNSTEDQKYRVHIK